MISNKPDEVEMKCSKSSNVRLFALFFLIMLYVVTHGYFVIAKTVSGELEGKQAPHTDATYYLDGALSILQFHAVEKFNDKHQPIMASKPVSASSLPAGSSVVAALYPAPSFKFGYSLTAAALTGWFDSKLFQLFLPRLVVTNMILGGFILVLIFITLNKFFDNIMIPTAACVFYVLDVWNIHNNYAYQSHTISGVFYTLLAYYLFVRRPFVTKLSYFLIANLLVFSLLSSSHLVLFSLALGVLIAMWVWFDNPNWQVRMRYVAVGFIGAAVWPAYILFVEYYIGFGQLGIPTYAMQLTNYSGTISTLISTYPLFQRQLWDITLWNPFMPALVVLLFGSLIFLATYEKVINGISHTGMISGVVSFIRNGWKKKSTPFILAALFFFAGTAFYSNPIVRAIVPDLLLLDILLGILTGIMLAKLGRASPFIAVIAIAILSSNFLLYTRLMNSGNKYLTSYPPAPYVWTIDESPRLWSHIGDYYSKGGKVVMPKGDFGQHSMSIDEFVSYLKKQLAGTPLGAHLDELWVQVTPMDIVEGYSHERRFIPEFTPLKENLANKEVIESDFRLMKELFEMAQDGRLASSAVVKSHIQVWNPVVFDQEYNYVYGYKGKIKELVKGGTLEQIDFRAVYYFNFKDIENATVSMKKN